MPNKFAKDIVSLVKNDGTRIDSILAQVASEKILIHDITLPIAEGDHIVRKLPNGLEDTYLVVDRGYHEGHGRLPSYFGIRYKKITGLPSESPVTNIYNLQGNNSRVNIHSTDSSTNVVNTTAETMFSQLRETIRGQIADAPYSKELLTAVDELEEAEGSPSFNERYQHLIGLAADHLTLLTPFLPMLTQMLHTG